MFIFDSKRGNGEILGVFPFSLPTRGVNYNQSLSSVHKKTIRKVSATWGFINHKGWEYSRCNKHTIASMSSTHVHYKHTLFYFVCDLYAHRINIQFFCIMRTIKKSIRSLYVALTIPSFPTPGSSDWKTAFRITYHRGFQKRKRIPSVCDKTHARIMAHKLQK